MTQQHLIHYSAMCFDCDARCDAKNAMAWAHNHARHKKHRVELQMGWRVACEEELRAPEQQTAA